MPNGFLGFETTHAYDVLYHSIPTCQMAFWVLGPLTYTMYYIILYQHAKCFLSLGSTNVYYVLYHSIPTCQMAFWVLGPLTYMMFYIIPYQHANWLSGSWDHLRIRCIISFHTNMPNGLLGLGTTYVYDVLYHSIPTCQMAFWVLGPLTYTMYYIIPYQHAKWLSGSWDHLRIRCIISFHTNMPNGFLDLGTTNLYDVLYHSIPTCQMAFWVLGPLKYMMYYIIPYQHAKWLSWFWDHSRIWCIISFHTNMPNGFLGLGTTYVYDVLYQSISTYQMAFWVLGPLTHMIYYIIPYQHPKWLSGSWDHSRIWCIISFYTNMPNGFLGLGATYVYDVLYHSIPTCQMAFWVLGPLTYAMYYIIPYQHAKWLSGSWGRKGSV